VIWSKLTLKIGVQQENIQEVNERGEQKGAFQEETIHLKEKTEHDTKPPI